MNMNCMICNKMIIGKRAHATVCSPDCLGEKKRRRLRENYVPRPRKTSKCLNCGGAFNQNRSGNGRAKTCSAYCQKQHEYNFNKNWQINNRDRKNARYRGNGEVARRRREESRIKGAKLRAAYKALKELGIQI
jgi:hypothetical protein